MGHKTIAQTLHTYAHVLAAVLAGMDDGEVLPEVLPPAAQVVDFPRRQRKIAPWCR